MVRKIPRQRQACTVRWSIGTSDEKSAGMWAVENRDRILSQYYARHAMPPAELYNILEKYYEEDSPFLQKDFNRGRTLCAEKRKTCDGFAKRKFVPYLKKNGIRDVGGIDTSLLARFQDHMLKTVKAQSVNGYMSAVKMIFNHFVIVGYVKFNPCAGLPCIKVFDREWENDLHRLLCMIIYTAGMRNGEINRIRLGDVMEIDGCKFIDIPKSKSASGVRKVPLHDFVHGKLMEHAKGADSIFPQRTRSFAALCAAANLSLAEQTGLSPEKLKEENIVFYSGRHFWKTLMSREGLGEDAEEVFMGHAVSADVAKLYNRKGKWGTDRMVEKALDVFAALDRCLFGEPGASPGSPRGGGWAIPRFSLSAFMNSRNCSLEAKPRLYSRFQWAQ